MLLQVALFRSFLWVSGVPLYICTTSFLSIGCGVFMDRRESFIAGKNNYNSWGKWRHDLLTRSFHSFIHSFIYNSSVTSIVAEWTYLHLEIITAPLPLPIIVCSHLPTTGSEIGLYIHKENEHQLLYCVATTAVTFLSDEQFSTSMSIGDSNFQEAPGQETEEGLARAPCILGAAFPISSMQEVKEEIGRDW